MSDTRKKSFVERIAAKVPDPVMIFLGLYVVGFACTVLFGGTTFAGPGGDGAAMSIRSMATAENVRWIFSNCLVRNWVSYAHGMLPIVFVVMMGIGVAEQSGFFSVLLRLLGRGVNDKLLANFFLSSEPASSPMSLAMPGISSSFPSPRRCMLRSAGIRWSASRRPLPA